jgi:hypothetical protein
VRHLPSIVVVAVWLGMMGLLVHRQAVRRGTDVASLPAPGEATAAPADEWFGVYQGERKIGYSHRVEWRTEGGRVLTDESHFTLAMLGRPQTLSTTLRAETDDAFNLRRFHFVLDSPAATFSAAGSSDGRRLEVRYGPDGKSDTLVIPLDEPIGLAGALRPRLAAAWPAPGARFTQQVFSPLAMRNEAVSIVVEAHETLDGEETLRLAEESQGLRARAWVTADGRTVREEAALGFVLRRERPEVARAGTAGGARVDLATMARVPFDGTIVDPRALGRLTLRLRGEAAARVPDAPPRQEVEGDLLRVTREPAPLAGVATAVDDAVARWARPSPFVESDDPAIVARARAVAGDAADPVERVRRLLAWVGEHVTQAPSLTVPSARDVLRVLRGDCNEHAVLVAALARAAGVPARVVAGLAYVDDGFYYHAWNEVWLGGWVSADAVLGQLPVDATHVKLVDGGPEQHLRLALVVGRLALARVPEGA